MGVAISPAAPQDFMRNEEIFQGLDMNCFLTDDDVVLLKNSIWREVRDDMTITERGYRHWKTFFSTEIFLTRHDLKK